MKHKEAGVFAAQEVPVDEEGSDTKLSKEVQERIDEQLKENEISDTSTEIVTE